MKSVNLEKELKSIAEKYWKSLGVTFNKLQHRDEIKLGYPKTTGYPKGRHDTFVPTRATFGSTNKANSVVCTLFGKPLLKNGKIGKEIMLHHSWSPSIKTKK